MTRPPDQSRTEYYLADAKPISSAYQRFRWFLAKATVYVALVYGVVTMRPYFAVLGLAGVLLFRWLERNDKSG